MAEGIQLRLTHTGVLSSNILLDDLNPVKAGTAQEYSYLPAPTAAVPNPQVTLTYGGSVPISFERGDIRRSIDNGWLTSEFIVGGQVKAGVREPTRVSSTAGAPSPDEYQTTVNQTLFLVDTSNDAVQLLLPPGDTHSTGFIEVIDAGNNASVNNIIVVANAAAGDLIEGGATDTISLDHGSEQYLWEAVAQAWFRVAKAAGGPPTGAAGGDLGGAYPNPSVDSVGGQTAAAIGGQLPSADEKAALAGTDGAPAVGNPYVTDSDARMTNSRAPSGAAGGDLGGIYPNPTVNDGADATAIHDDTAGEIAAIAEKVAPVGTDLVLIEDSGAGNVKKKVQITNLPSGSPSGAAGGDLGGTYPNPSVDSVGGQTAAAIGGQLPSADEKAALAGTDGAPAVGNPYVTDSDPRMTNSRTPSTHDLGGAEHNADTLANLNTKLIGSTLLDAEGTVPRLYAPFTPIAVPPYVEGRVFYDNVDKTLAVQVAGGSTLQLGQEEFVRILNQTGSLIANGEAVYFAGASAGRPLGALAQANAAATSHTLLGIATANIADGSEGFVTTQGLVRNLDTTGPGAEVWAEGDILYISSTTAGGLTNIKPTSPDHAVRLGYVITVDGANGIIKVSIRLGEDLGDLHDVSPAAAVDKALLQYNAGSSLWEPQDVGVAMEGVKRIRAGVFTTFTSITTALATAISGDVVVVSAGTYSESFTIPDGVRVIGYPAAQSVIIAGVDATSARVTFAGAGTLREVTVVAPSAGANPAIDLTGLGGGKLAVLFAVVIQGAGATGPGILGVGDGILAALGGLYHNGGVLGSLAEITGGTAILQQMILNVGSVTSGIKSSGSPLVEIRDMLVQPSTLYSGTNMFEVGGGILTVNGLQNSDSNPAFTTAVHITADGVEIRMNAADLQGTTYDWLVDPALTGAGTHLDIAACHFRVERLSFPLAFTTNASIHAQFLDDADANDPAFRFISELTVGIPEIPAEAAFGEGDSSVLGMQVFSFNGVATWVDNTTAAKSAAASPFDLFQGTGIGQIAYVGSLTRKFSGLKADILLKLLRGGGDIVTEYWNGATWTEFRTFTTQESYPYVSYANALFTNAEGQQIRFDTSIFGDWATTAVNGVTAYWMRFRITGAITQIPELERFKLHTNRTEINADGLIEFFGQAQPSFEIPGVAMGSLIPLSAITPSNQNTNLSINTNLQLTNNRFDPGRDDGFGFVVRVPVNLDTSRLMRFKVGWFPLINGTGTVALRAYVSGAVAVGTDINSGTVPEQEIILADTSRPTAPNQTDAVPEINVNSPGQLYISTYEFSLPDQVVDSFFGLSLIRKSSTIGDTYGGRIGIVFVDLEGIKWRV